MKLAVFSDLHITGNQDPFYRAFLDSLASEAGSESTVVLAGDIFDLFVGEKSYFHEEYSEFFKILMNAAQKGTRLYYIEGNHDFQIRSAFANVSGMTVSSKEVALEIEGRRFFIAHGDLIDREDYGYQALRIFLRSPIMKGIIAAAPGALVQAIGKRSSDASRKYRNPNIDRAERVRRAFRSFAADKISQGFDTVILGHSHDLDEMGFQVGDRHGQYMNMGFPRIHHSYLRWETGEAQVYRQTLPIGNPSRAPHN